MGVYEGTAARAYGPASKTGQHPYYSALKPLLDAHAEQLAKAIGHNYSLRRR
ncbi:hypothetical protein [Streptomyces sp. N2A]|uniref:hypothetical protein n=1 Tax=Streptomyces sp. N2A TaxID=3073936 RepID=UPI00287033EE|nr:hypothetical protein [Streptomyces sp. N2A]